MTKHLYGLRVLVVEDEYLIALMICEILEKVGCVVVGPASSLESARKLSSRESIDGALLDINLNGEVVYPVADQLDRLNVPYVFVSGYGTVKLPDRFQDRPFITKPFLPHVLVQALESITGNGGQFRPAVV